MKIAGIDPGTARIGYALLECWGAAVVLRRAETITIPQRRTAAEGLMILAQALEERLARDRPDAVAIEKLYFSRNAKTAIAVAEARGVILLTARRAVPSIWEYAPLEVKLAVAGYGRGDKSQVRRAIAFHFPRSHLPQGDDALDAIAIALTATAHRRPGHGKGRPSAISPEAL